MVVFVSRQEEVDYLEFFAGFGVSSVKSRLLTFF